MRKDLLTAKFLRQANSSAEERRDAAMMAQLLGACGAEWGVAPPSIFEQLRAFAMTPQCQLPPPNFCATRFGAVGVL